MADELDLAGRIWWERISRAERANDPGSSSSWAHYKLMMELLCYLARRETHLLDSSVRPPVWAEVRSPAVILGALGEYHGVGPPPASVVAQAEATREGTSA